MRHAVLAVIAAALFVPFVEAQNGPGQAFTCVANAGTPPTVRVEGITELVGDLLLQCTGGTPTASGKPVPVANLRLTLNTNVTSRLLGGGYIDALLLIDDPNPSQQKVCGAPGTSYNGDGTCTVFGNGTGVGTYTAPSAATIYVARAAGINAIEWDGVPIDAPGDGAPRVVRITNVRADATQLGLSNTLIPTQITGFISTESHFISVNNPNQTLARVQPASSFGVLNAFANKDCSSINTGLLNGGTTPDGTPPLTIQIGELFPNAWKPKATTGSGGALVNQNIPGTVYNTESGFYNSSFPDLEGIGPGSEIGNAAFGTRFLLRFNKVGAGVQLVLPGVVPLTVDPSGNPSGGSASLLDPSGQPVTTPYYSLPVNSLQQASATYEITDADPTQNEVLNIPVYPAYIGGTVLGQIGEGTTTVNGQFAPQVTVPLNLQVTAPTQIPSFGDFSTGIVAPQTNTDVAAFTVRSCNGTSQTLSAYVPGLSTFSTPLVFNSYQGIVVPPLFNLSLVAPDNQITDVSVAAMDSGPTDWLSAAVNQKTTPATTYIRADPTGLTPNTYSGTVTFNSAQASPAPLPIPVTLTVNPVGPLFFRTGFTNAGSYVANAAAPGELFTVFTQNAGSTPIAGPQLGSDGKYPTQLGGMQVLFDGQPAPLYFAVAGQVAGFVPFGVAGKTTTQVQVKYNSALSPAVAIPVYDAVPGIFTADESGGGQGAILNQDGSYNAQTPESPGNIIQIIGTGGGQTTPGGRDGGIAGTGEMLQLPVQVFIDGNPATDVTASSWAGAPEGVFSIKARIPTNTRHPADVPVVISVGDKQTQPGVTISVK